MAAPHVPEIEVREPSRRLVASVRIKSHPSQLRHTIAGAQDQVLEVIGAEGLAPAGPLFTRYHRIGPIADLEVGVPLAQTIRQHPTVMNSTLPGGPALHAVCVGSHTNLIQTVRALNEHAAAVGLKTNGGYWEYYLAEPIPGLDLCSVEFYLPVVGVRTNGRRPQEREDLVACEIRPEPATKSLFARPGPRWEEGVVDIDAAPPSHLKSSTEVARTGSRNLSADYDESEPEA